MDTLNAGDTAWILVATALVMMMTPAQFAVDRAAPLRRAKRVRSA